MSLPPSELQQFPVIEPLVARHAADAAFYWMQRNANTHSPLLHFDRLQHFDRLLNAHLDGLRVAGDIGWQHALKNLQRWKSNGESFVAYLLAFESSDAARLLTLWEIVRQHPDTTQKGVVSALGWLDEDVALPLLAHWLGRSEFVWMQWIALQAYGIRRLAPTTDIAAFFQSEHAMVRAAACTLTGRVKLRQHEAALQAARKDADQSVRTAALIALQLLGKGEDILSDLWQTLQHLNKVEQESTGWAQHVAQQQTLSIARHLGHAVPAGHAGLQQALARLPARQGVLVMAHHGDAASVPALLDHMDDQNLARLAAWALTMITGIDLEAQGLSLPPAPPAEDEDERSTPLRDPDVGLPWPNALAVRAWWQANGAQYPGGVRLLFGQSVTDADHCADILAYGVQGARWATALNLAQSDAAIPYFAINAPAIAQQELLT